MRESRNALDHPLSQTRLRLRLGVCLLCGILVIQGAISLAHPGIVAPSSRMTGVAPHFAQFAGSMAR
ncbi:hypothetical protein [Sphingomonas oryzagri]